MIARALTPSPDPEERPGTAGALLEIGAPSSQLMAQELGLSTTLVTHWIEEKVKVLVECPRAWDLVGVMPLGYAAAPRERIHRPLEPLVFQDTFGTPWRPQT